MIGQRRMTRLGRGRPSEREASEREEESESKKEAVSPHGGDSTMDESGSSFATPFRTDLKKSKLILSHMPTVERDLEYTNIRCRGGEPFDWHRRVTPAVSLRDPDLAGMLVVANRRDEWIGARRDSS